MQIIRDLTEAQITEPVVLTIGTFDGVHRGHQALIKQLREAALKHKAKSAVLAFHPRPKAIFNPQAHAHDYLTTPEERIALFEQIGLDILILLPFSMELAQHSARDFMTLLIDHVNLVELWAGHDFALGKGREGNIEKLTALGQEFNYSVHNFEPFKLGGETISSTRIRQLLQGGDVRKAAQLLGRYPTLTGEVIEGAKRGRTLGFPTANLAMPPERLIPANGVYATFVHRPGNSRRFASVANIGVRPSFEETKRTVETYIFDFNEKLYGQQLTLEFVEYLRPEKKFAGINELVDQIAHDVEHARSILAKEVASTR
jgi:riboflavin kinase/FMN adenylyltransferase